MTDEECQALDCINEYKQPNSMVDAGNLLWAAETLADSLMLKSGAPKTWREISISHRQATVRAKRRAAKLWSMLKHAVGDRKLYRSEFMNAEAKLNVLRENLANSDTEHLLKEIARLNQLIDSFEVVE